jgi:hypothetical protein
MNETSKCLESVKSSSNFMSQPSNREMFKQFLNRFKKKMKTQIEKTKSRLPAYEIKITWWAKIIRKNSARGGIIDKEA